VNWRPFWTLQHCVQAWNSRTIHCELVCNSTTNTCNSTRYTTHSTQHTVHTHSTQYTAHSTHTVHSTQHTVHSTQHTVHSTQHTVHSTHTVHRLSANKSNSTQYVMQNNSEFVIPGCVAAGRTCQTDCRHYLRLHSTCNSADCLQNVRNSTLARCHKLCRISEYPSIAHCNVVIIGR